MNIETFTVYEIETGKITGRVTCPFEMLVHNVPDECSAILGDYSDSDFIVDVENEPHEATPKLPLPYSIDKLVITASAEDFLTINGVPSGSLVRWPDGSLEVVSGGPMHFATDLPGEHRISITADRYLKCEIVITAI